jgi:hypothetical protein
MPRSRCRYQADIRPIRPGGHPKIALSALLAMLTCGYFVTQPFGHGIAPTGVKLPPDD